MKIDDSTQLVSIIIATKDRYELVKGCIENVLEQTYSNFEIIVVEDGSDCGIKDHIKTLNDECIIYHAHKIKKGVGAARNTGVEIANGKYVAFIDDDERWVEDKIALQNDLINSLDNEKFMVYCGNLRLNENELAKEFIPSTRGMMLPHFYSGYYINSSCMMLLRKSLLLIGGHSENLSSCIDHDLWLKLSQSGFYMDFVPKGLVYSVKHQHNRMMENIDERLKGIKEFFEKWRGIIKNKAGEEAWIKIEHIYHFQTSHMLMEQYKLGKIDSRKFSVAINKLFDLQVRNYSWLDVWMVKYGKIHLTPILKSKFKAIYSLIGYVRRNSIFK